MLKYMAGLVLIVGLAFYVSVQDERATQQSAQETTKLDKAAVPTKPDENHSQKNISNPERNTPSWYRIFRWPDGTTPWVIILTLIAIAEQAKQTAEATETMKRSLILQFRPKLLVRKVFLRKGTDIPTIGVPDDRPWGVDYVMANIGGSRATLKRSGFEFTPFDTGLTRLAYTMREPAEPILIEPGEEKGFSIVMEDELVRLFRILGPTGRDLSNQKIACLYFWGSAQYADDTGIVRNIALCRHYETGTGKFTPSDDPDEEYAD